MNEMIVGVNGVSFYQENVKLLAREEVGSYELTREPNNLYDPNAISVRVGKYLLGYIPATYTKSLARDMDLGKHFSALFHRRLDGFVGGNVGFQIMIKEEIE